MGSKRRGCFSDLLGLRRSRPPEPPESEDKTPAKFYRDWLRMAFFKPPADDLAFRALLDEMYAAANARLSAPDDDQPTRKELRDAKMTVYISAVGLLTCGRLEVVPDVMSGIPPGHGIHPGVRGVAMCVSALLPVPDGWSVYHNGHLIAGWWEENRSKLDWDEQSGVFEWKPEA
jgi:hypothetical protein